MPDKLPPRLCVCVTCFILSSVTILTNLDLKKLNRKQWKLYLCYYSFRFFSARQYLTSLFSFFVEWTSETEKTNKETDFEPGNFARLIDFSTQANRLYKVQIWHKVKSRPYIAKWKVLFQSTLIISRNSKVVVPQRSFGSFTSRVSHFPDQLFFYQF